MAAQWTAADAWVFAALGSTSPDNGCTLTDLIATADHINHAILTEAEFTTALPRLVTAGLVGTNAERYWQTEAGSAMYQQKMKRRGLFGWIDAIPPALRRLGDPVDSPWSLPPGAFSRAVDEYLRR